MVTLRTQMKTTLAVFSLFLSSCAYRSGATYAGGQVVSKWTDMTLGTDLKNAVTTAEGMAVGEQNQSKVAMSAIRTAGTIGTSAIVNNMLETVNGNAAAIDINASNNAAAGMLAKESTKQAGINADAAVESLKVVTP